MRRRRIARGLAFAVVTLGLAPSAVAQPSTARLEEEPRWSTELSIGRETPLLDGVFAHSGGDGMPALAAIVARRWAPSGSPVGVRATGWWLRRQGAWSVDYGDGPPFRYEVEETLAALGLAVDLGFRFGSRVRVAPALGVGLVPVARSRTATTSPNGERSDTEGSGSGRMWSAGLAVRVGRLVLEQHVIGLLGASHIGAVRREYFPLTIGWRF